VAEDAPPKFTLRIDALTSKKMACARTKPLAAAALV